MPCDQVLPPADGHDAVPMSELLARAEMETKAESATQVNTCCVYLIFFFFFEVLLFYQRE